MTWSALRHDWSQQVPHTLVVKDLRLGRILCVDTVEREGVIFSVVLGIGNLHDRLCIGRFCARIVFGVNNDIFFNLGLEQGSDAGDDANTHCYMWLDFFPLVGA